MPQTFEDPILKSFDAETIRRAFLTLPERTRAVLWYAAVEDLKPAAFGRLLGLSPNAASAALKRARERLAQAYLQCHVRAVQDGECRLTGPSLAAYAAGRLRGAELARTRFHVENCLTCSAAVLHLRDVNRGLRAAYLPLAATAPMAGGLLAALGLGASAPPSARAAGWGVAAGHGGTSGAAAVTSAVVVIGVAVGIGTARLVTADPAPAQTLAGAVQNPLTTGAGQLPGGTTSTGAPNYLAGGPSGASGVGPGGSGVGATPNAFGAGGSVPGGGVWAPGNPGGQALGNPGQLPQAGGVPGFPGSAADISTFLGPGLGAAGGGGIGAVAGATDPLPPGPGSLLPGGGGPGAATAQPPGVPPAPGGPTGGAVLPPPAPNPPGPNPPAPNPTGGGTSSPTAVPTTSGPGATPTSSTPSPSGTPTDNPSPTGPVLGLTVEIGVNGQFWQPGPVAVYTGRVTVTAPVADMDRRLTLRLEVEGGWQGILRPASPAPTSGSSTAAPSDAAAPTTSSDAAAPTTMPDAAAPTTMPVDDPTGTIPTESDSPTTDGMTTLLGTPTRGARPVVVSLRVDLPAGQSTKSIKIVAVRASLPSPGPAVPAIAWKLTDPRDGASVEGELPPWKPASASDSPTARPSTDPAPEGTISISTGPTITASLRSPF
ncbi:hypothetical protein BKD30_00810 [Tersicoccus phoenicis]|uniref:RNA polymerase sigma factor 70 region 4 type 2 domain-containing protein n=1 Tax=Tersicoccus phoenicis TaxID=554083 RepID=A0A1R1LP06_9MICC|nr:sigma-70 family RNA polymerase sigma factor [Tersicoccus phoenicis]OMH29270.1 hypothetical protein BKD30_00810 [Tersicoccus phoenicis]